MSPSLRAGGLSEPEAGAEPGPEGKEGRACLPVGRGRFSDECVFSIMDSLVRSSSLHRGRGLCWGNFKYLWLGFGI